MKSEERIVELMAEYLRKSDQLLDRMDHTDKHTEQTNRNIDMMSRAMAENDVKFNAMNEKFNEEVKQLHKEHNRLREEQGVMLKELVSLSKRIGVVEEKH
jgi:aspartokinase